MFDPVTGQLATIAPMAYEILAFLKDRIEGGVTSRQALLEELLAEVAQAGEEPGPDAVLHATDNLAGWIELARHLYA